MISLVVDYNKADAPAFNQELARYEVATKQAELDGANLSIERNMCMPYDDQVCLAASQPFLQFAIAMLVLDTRSVVSAWRSMDAEQACAIR